MGAQASTKSSDLNHEEDKREILEQCSNLRDISTSSIGAYAKTLGVSTIEDKDTMIVLIVTELLKRNRDKLLRRSSTAGRIEEALSQISKTRQRACFSDTISDVVDLMKRLGYGAEGVVHTAKIDSVAEMVVVKFSKTSKKLITEIVGRKIVWWKVPHTKMLKEILNGKMVNEILKRNATPSLVWFYGWFMCDRCTETIRIIKKGGKVVGTEQSSAPCLISLWEKELGDVKSIVGKLTRDDARIMLFQIIWGLFCLDFYWGLDHADTEYRNIFYSVHSKGGYAIYETEKGDKFYVPMGRYSFYIGDYGFARSDRYHGTQRGKISNPLGGGYKPRDLQGKKMPNLPQPHSNMNARTQYPISLYKFLSTAKIRKISQDLEGVIDEIAAIIPDPTKVRVTKGDQSHKSKRMDYVFILKHFFSDWMVYNGNESPFTTYKIKGFDVNPDKLYIKLATDTAMGK